MISPEQVERLANGVREAFDDLEALILERIANRLGEGINSPNWQERKLSEIQRLKLEVDRMVNNFTENANKEVERVVRQAFQEGVDSADFDYGEYVRAVPTLTTASIVGSFGTINEVAVTAIVAETIGAIDSMKFNILRKTDDIYRQVISRASVATIAGVETKLQTVQRVINEFADSGITGFTDVRGRNWNIGSYADMAVRTAVGRSAMAGHETRLTQLGEDLVIVSQHPDECPLCRPHEGKIYSISGMSTKYPPLSQAKESGLFHPNCGHVATGYFEGFTEPMPKKMGTPSDYEEKQKQRAIERQIRKWKMRESVAISPQVKQQARAKVREWQSVMRDFISKTDRRRKYEREQINFGVNR